MVLAKKIINLSYYTLPPLHLISLTTRTINVEFGSKMGNGIKINLSYIGQAKSLTVFLN